MRNFEKFNMVLRGKRLWRFVLEEDWPQRGGGIEIRAESLGRLPKSCNYLLELAC